MATILLSAVQMFCNVPAAPVLGSLLAAVLPNPITIVSFVAWFLAIKYSRAKWIARFKGPTKTMLKWALLFHMLTVTPVFAIIILTTCRAVG